MSINFSHSNHVKNVINTSDPVAALFNSLLSGFVFNGDCESSGDSEDSLSFSQSEDSWSFSQSSSLSDDSKSSCNAIYTKYADCPTTVEWVDVRGHIHNYSPCNHPIYHRPDVYFEYTHHHHIHHNHGNNNDDYVGDVNESGACEIF
jgi:hypothetical protein